MSSLHEVVMSSDNVNKYDLIEKNDFSGLFNLVRDIIEFKMNKKRSHILLGLIELGFNRGGFIGGLHLGGTNEIFLNKSALKVMEQESKPEYFKAYVFILLLHEYIHSVGVMNELRTRKFTRIIAQEIFGNDHPVTKLAVEGIQKYFPYNFDSRKYIPTRKERATIEFVKIIHPDSELTYQ